MMRCCVDVEEGGETAFPSLNIAVRPKKGRALLWPSTLDAAPEEIDDRTRHEARAVSNCHSSPIDVTIPLVNCLVS